MNLSIDIVLHVIVENIKLEAHSYALHFSKKVFIYKINKKKKYTGTIILYRVFNITCYRIHINYRILTVTGL